MTAVDWSLWCKCPVCAAELGQPCSQLTGFTLAGKAAAVNVAAPRPHGGRKPRAVAS